MVAARHDVPSWHGNWRDLVERDDIDVVSIAVPPSLQPEIATAAACHGKHVFCEKPVSTTLEAAEALVTQVRRVGIRHAMDFEFPELPEWREAGSIVHSGALGRVHELRIVWSTQGGTNRSARSSWKREDDRGGGVLGGFLSHALYHSMWLCGSLDVVEASLAGADGQTTSCQVVLAGGNRQVVRVAIDSDSPGPRRHSLEVLGTAGTLRLESKVIGHAGPFALNISGHEVEIAIDNEFGTDRRMIAVSRLVARFVDAIRTGSEMRPDLVDGLNVARLLEATRAAAGRS